MFYKMMEYAQKNSSSSNIFEKWFAKILKFFLIPYSAYAWAFKPIPLDIKKGLSKTEKKKRKLQSMTREMIREYLDRHNGIDRIIIDADLILYKSVAPKIDEIDFKNFKTRDARIYLNQFMGIIINKVANLLREKLNKMIKDIIDDVTMSIVPNDKLKEDLKIYVNNRYLKNYNKNPYEVYANVKENLRLDLKKHAKYLAAEYYQKSPRVSIDDVLINNKGLNKDEFNICLNERKIEIEDFIREKIKKEIDEKGLVLTDKEIKEKIDENLKIYRKDENWEVAGESIKDRILENLTKYQRDKNGGNNSFPLAPVIKPVPNRNKNRKRNEAPHYETATITFLNKGSVRLVCKENKYFVTEKQLEKLLSNDIKINNNKGKNVIMHNGTEYEINVVKSRNKLESYENAYSSGRIRKEYLKKESLKNKEAVYSWLKRKEEKIEKARDELKKEINKVNSKNLSNKKHKGKQNPSTKKMKIKKILGDVNLDNIGDLNDEKIYQILDEIRKLDNQKGKSR